MTHWVELQPQEGRLAIEKADARRNDRELECLLISKDKRLGAPAIAAALIGCSDFKVVEVGYR